MFKNYFNSMVVTATILGTAITQAQTFYYDILATSSGSATYACNAGLRTQNRDCDICYQDLGNGTRVTVSRPPSCDINQANCGSRITCANTGANSGRHLLNYMKVKTRNFIGNNQGIFQDTPPLHSSTPSFAQYFQNSSAFDHELDGGLRINLSNELYNAQYFVDICFRAPQIEFKKDNVNATYNITANVGSSELLQATARYTQQSGLKTQAFIVCDLQAEGTYQNAANNAGEYNTSLNEADFEIGSDGLPVDNARTWVSPITTITGDALDLITVPAVLNPRFCKVRYMFTETAGLNCDGGASAFRDWNHKTAKICTKTTFNEPQAQQP